MEEERERYLSNEEIEEMVRGFELDLKYNWKRNDSREEKLEAVKSSLVDIKMLEAEVEDDNEELQERIIKLRLAYERKEAELE